MREAIEKKNRDGILEHQIDKKTPVFCSMLFTAFLLADFKRKPDYVLVLKYIQQTSAIQKKPSLFMNGIL